MAGLGAFGGASLGTALGAGTGQGFLGGLFGGGAPATGAATGVAGAATPAAALPGVPTAAASTAPAATTAASKALAGQIQPLSQEAIKASIGNAPFNPVLNPAPNLVERFIGAARDIPASQITGIGDMGWRGGAAGLGLALPFLQQDAPKMPDEDKYDPISEYRPLSPRQVSYPGPGYGSREYSYFNPSTYPFARGGEVPLRDGSFILDARTVSEIGNGSSGAGQERLARLGGKPIKGPGDGVSDSIRANIGGVQQARIARDEVQFGPEAVRRIGGGDRERGAQKLYRLMDKAHRERRAVKRGEPNKGLGALLK